MFDRTRNSSRGRAPERLDQRYPYAAQFFGCYLHQDWPEESASWEAAADLFLAKESSDHAQRAATDIHQLLADAREDAALVRALDVFGNAYDPGVDGLSLRTWLLKVRDRLATGRNRDPAV